MNCVGADRVAQFVSPHNTMTILCRNAMTHLSKFYDAAYLCQHGLTSNATGLEFLGMR